MKSLNKFLTHPDYEKYSQLINQLDSDASPQIVIAHRSSNPIRESGKKLGIFSGSFNPITVAHTKMFQGSTSTFSIG